MPGLSRHKLPTLPDKKPVKQENRRMNADTQLLVKEEVESGVIRVARYSEWIPFFYTVRKKDGKMRHKGARPRGRRRW